MTQTQTADITSQDLRARIVCEARSWIGTKYLSGAMVKGAGVDCATLLFAVYREVGLVPRNLELGHYSPQWHLHQGEERYKNFVERFAHEVELPGPGDVVLFKIGRLFAHGGIVTKWPKIVHARAPGSCWEEDVSADKFGKHALWLTDRKFYSWW